MPVMRTAWIISRVMRFRSELALLWRAFLAAETPLHLKLLMLLVPLYLVSPVDLISDFIPILGWLDDLVVVPFLIGWISRMIENWQAAQRSAGADSPRSPMIDVTTRRR